MDSTDIPSDGYVSSGRGGPRDIQGVQGEVLGQGK